MTVSEADAITATTAYSQLTVQTSEQSSASTNTKRKYFVQFTVQKFKETGLYFMQMHLNELAKIPHFTMFLLQI